MKRLAITMGDPGGVGPEIIVKALSFASMNDCRSIVVIGDRTPLEEALRLLKEPAKLRIIKSPEESNLTFLGRAIDLIDMGVIKKFKKGRPTAEGGRASVLYIKRAVVLALEKQVDGIVTAPISKESWKIAGFKWPGHTEMLAELTYTKDYAMMLIGGKLKVILVTIHTPLKNVPALITRDRILKTIRLTKKACHMLGIKRPRIAVAGLIPLKMVAFDEGVNVTVGLPFIRTSPDHGTAYDIAWKGIANPSSMIQAIKLASTLRI